MGARTVRLSTFSKIYFNIPPEKEMHKGLKWHEGEWLRKQITFLGGLCLEDNLTFLLVYSANTLLIIVACKSSDMIIELTSIPCRILTESRLWLTERRVCWTSWTLQVRRSTVPWEISIWGQERAFCVCLPSTMPSPLRTYIYTGT